jgi:hypothetical protein
LAGHLHCRINVGTAGAPEGRGIIESYHKKLTENGYQRLPSTTGSSARSPKRRDPEAKARRYHLTLAAAEQLLQVIVGEYNNTIHGTTNHTPLDYIRAWDAGGGLSRRLPKAVRSLDFLYERTVRLPVRGGVQSGTRPYVQYLGARYRNPELASNGQAVGTYLTACYDSRNIALMRVFLPSGEPLGIVRAQGRWGLSPHSLKTRKAILSLEKAGLLSPVTADPLEGYLAHLKQAAKTHRAAANELVRVRRERGESTEVPDVTNKADQARRTIVENPPGPIARTDHYAPPPPERAKAPIMTQRALARGHGLQLTLGAGVKIRRAVRGG